MQCVLEMRFLKAVPSETRDTSPIFIFFDIINYNRIHTCV